MYSTCCYEGGLLKHLVNSSQRALLKKNNHAVPTSTLRDRDGGGADPGFHAIRSIHKSVEKHYLCKTFVARQYIYAGTVSLHLLWRTELQRCQNRIKLQHQMVDEPSASLALVHNIGLEICCY